VPARAVNQKKEAKIMRTLLLVSTPPLSPVGPHGFSPGKPAAFHFAAKLARLFFSNGIFHTGFFVASFPSSAFPLMHVAPAGCCIPLVFLAKLVRVFVRIYMQE
jgi:hypothetical protein